MTPWLCFNIRLPVLKCCFLWFVGCFFFLYIPTTFKKILNTFWLYIFIYNEDDGIFQFCLV